MKEAAHICRWEGCRTIGPSAARRREISQWCAAYVRAAAAARCRRPRRRRHLPPRSTTCSSGTTAYSAASRCTNAENLFLLHSATFTRFEFQRTFVLCSSIHIPSSLCILQYNWVNYEKKYGKSRYTACHSLLLAGSISTWYTRTLKLENCQSRHTLLSDHPALFLPQFLMHHFCTPLLSADCQRYSRGTRNETPTLVLTSALLETSVR